MLSPQQDQEELFTEGELVASDNASAIEAVANGDTIGILQYVLHRWGVGDQHGEISGRTAAELIRLGVVRAVRRSYALDTISPSQRAGKKTP